MNTWRKVATLMLGVVACTTVLFAPVTSAGERNVTLHFAGTGWDTQLDATQGPGTPVQLTVADARGFFGESVLSITTEWRFTENSCAGDFDVLAELVNSALVITAADQSQVFGFSQYGWMCVNSTTGLYYGETYGIYNGGAGRYAAASGEWTATFDGATLDPSISFRSIRGTSTGRLVTP